MQDAQNALQFALSQPEEFFVLEFLYCRKNRR